MFQEFATLDLLSGGRAEIMAGRGSFIESFPLFGYDLNFYDELFAEKLELLLQLRESERVTWAGRHRAAARQPRRVPAPVSGSDPDLGGGRRQPRRRLCGPARSAFRWRWPSSAAMPERFASFVELFREAGRRAGHDAARLLLGINSHGYVADTSRTRQTSSFRLRGDDERDRP